LKAVLGPRVQAYLAAGVAVVAAVVVRLILHAWVSEGLPFLPFFIAVVAASAYGGFGPGVLAAALSTIAASWIVPPEWLAVGDVSATGALVRFIFVGAVVAWLNDRLRQARTVQEHAAARIAAQEASLRDADLAHRRLAAIVESSDDSILGLDMNGIITSWNRGAERLYGYTAAEAVGQPVTIVVPPERIDDEERMLARLRTGDRVEQFETERVRKDRSRFDVSVTLSPIMDASGRMTGASKIARDITDRRRAERVREELLERERHALAEAVAAGDRLAFLAEISALLTSSLDYQETLDRAVHLALPRLGDYCNVLVEDEHGHLRHVAWGHVDRAKEPAVRDLVRLVLEAPDEPAASARFESRRASASPAEAPSARRRVPTFADVVMKTAKRIVVNHAAIVEAMAKLPKDLDPALLQLGMTLQPYAYLGVPLLSRGRPIGVMSFGTSEQESRREYSDTDIALVEEFARRVSTAIDNARLFRQADELNRLKDEFLATLSHELRTPLSAILGWSRMLAAKQLDDERAARAVEAIERNAQAQSQIVDDILDVARGMAGNLRLDVKPVDLVAVAHRGVEAIAPAAAAKRLDVNVTSSGPVSVLGDAGRLQQVVWNLLSNAVKFTGAGGHITIAVQSTDNHAELSVADTGIGIAPAFLPFVFDKFRQADGSYTRQHGGLGLGLAIARHLTELHGGSIEARSGGEGHGALFTVRLPLASS
jgi:PAS domain S-box-containing protein